MKLTLSVSGFDDIANNIKSIQRAMQGALEDIAMTGALLIENEAKILAPVKTGTLRRSIHTEITSASSTAAVATVGPSVDYAEYVEYGTRHQHPQPFMRPAFDSKHDEALSDMEAIARETISDALLEEINARASSRNSRNSRRPIP